jgi:hypothetical protein
MGSMDPSHLPLDEHVGIIQEFEEVRCFSRCETSYLLVVFIGMIFLCLCKLPVAHLHLHLRCAKPEAQEFEGKRHADNLDLVFILIYHIDRGLRSTGV